MVIFYVFVNAFFSLYAFSDIIHCTQRGLASCYDQYFVFNRHVGQVGGLDMRDEADNHLSSLSHFCLSITCSGNKRQAEFLKDERNPVSPTIRKIRELGNTQNPRKDINNQNQVSFAVFNNS